MVSAFWMYWMNWPGIHTTRHRPPSVQGNEEFGPVFPVWRESHPPDHFTFFQKLTVINFSSNAFFFPRNLLRFSAERENMTAATVKTVIVCICWAKLRHFQTCLQCVKERLTAQEKKKNSLFPIREEEHTTHSKWYIFLNKKLYSAQMWITTIEMRSFIYWMC